MATVSLLIAFNVCPEQGWGFTPTVSRGHQQAARKTPSAGDGIFARLTSNRVESIALVRPAATGRRRIVDPRGALLHARARSIDVTADHDQLIANGAQAAIRSRRRFCAVDVDARPRETGRVEAVQFAGQSISLQIDDSAVRVDHATDRCASAVPRRRRAVLRFRRVDAPFASNEIEHVHLLLRAEFPRVRALVASFAAPNEHPLRVRDRFVAATRARTLRRSAP